MKAFANGACRVTGETLFTDWCGVTIVVDEHALRGLGYSEVRGLDVTAPGELQTAIVALGGPASFDAVLVLHMLEHLEQPEETILALRTAVRPGGLVVGGTPGTPGFVQPWWERRLRRDAAPFGHVSAFSPRRVCALAAAADLELLWMRGAFCMRMSGSQLEDNASWFRANLWWGACFPGWPGELYWTMRKAVQSDAKALRVSRPEPGRVVPG